MQSAIKQKSADPSTVRVLALGAAATVLILAASLSGVTPRTLVTMLTCGSGMGAATATAHRARTAEPNVVKKRILVLVPCGFGG